MMNTIILNSIMILGIIAIWINLTDEGELLGSIRKILYKSDGDTLRTPLFKPLVCGVCATFWLGLVYVAANQFIVQYVALDWAVYTVILAYLMANVYFKYMGHEDITKELIDSYIDDQLDKKEMVKHKTSKPN